ncbi:MAG: TolC family protein [Clostridia bacterium]
MMKKVLGLITIISIIFTFTISLAQEADNPEIVSEVDEQEQEVLTLTLDEAIEMTLSNNLEKQVAEAQMELQDIQIDISKDGNAELRRLERDMRRTADQLSSQVIDIQREIEYVENVEFEELTTTAGSIEIIGENYYELVERPISRQVLSGMVNQVESTTGVSNDEAVEIVKLMEPSNLIEGLEEAESQASEAFFEINTGKNETVKQANSMAASVLGLQSTRRLTMTQAVDIIQTKTRQSAELLVYSDTDTTEGFKLLAESSFYDLLQAKKMLAVQQKAFERSNEQYDNSILTYELGTLSKSDLQLIKMQHNNDNITIKNAESDLEKSKMEFNKAVGLPIDSEVELVEPEYEKVDLTLEEALEIAYEYRTDMFQARQEIDLAEKNLEYVDERHRDNSIEYKESAAYYNHKNLAYDNTWLNAKETVTKAHMDYQQAEMSYETALENLDIMKEQLDIAQLTYELGQGSNGSSPLVGLLQAQEQLANVEQSVAAAEFGKNLAWKNYLKEVGYAHFLDDNE